MKMTTSKIKAIKNVSEPWGDNKILWHMLEMDNGDKINIGKMKRQEIGYELTYEITGEGHEYNKAKPVNPNNFNRPSGAFKSNDNRQESIIRQSSLKTAVEYLKGAEASLEELFETTEKMISFINKSEINKTVKEELEGRKDMERQDNNNDLPF